MSYKLGRDAILEFNAQEIAAGTPSWAEVPEVVSVTMSQSMGNADRTSRDTGGYRSQVPTLREVTVSATIINQNGADNAGLLAIRNAYNGVGNNGRPYPMGLRVIDGDTTGSEMFTADFMVSSISRPEELEGVQVVTVEFAVYVGETKPTVTTYTPA